MLKKSSVFITVISFFCVNASYAMDPEPDRMSSLVDLALSVMFFHSRIALNSEMQGSLAVEEKIRMSAFSKKNELFDEIYKKAILVTKHQFRRHGRIDAGFDEYFEKIIVNQSFDNFEHCRHYDCDCGKWTNVKEWHVIGLDGKQIRIYDGFYESPNFKNPDRFFTREQVKAINEEYGIDFKVGDYNYSSYSRVSEGNKFLEVNFYYRNIRLYDVSRRNQLKNFCENRMPLEQVFLLIAINEAKKQGKYLKLTEKEQLIFSGLLPEIKQVALHYVVPSSQGILRDIIFKFCRRQELKYE